MKKSTIGQLDAAQLSISRTLEVCTSTNKVSLLKSALNSTLTELAETTQYLQSRPRVLSKTKKAIVSIQNTVQGMLDGLESSDLTVREFRAICSNLQSSFIPKMDSAIAEEVKRLPQPPPPPENEVELEAKSNSRIPTSEMSDSFKEMRKVVVAGGSLHDMLLAVKKQLVDSTNRATSVPVSAVLGSPKGDSKEDDYQPVHPKDAARDASRDLFYKKEHDNAGIHLAALNRFKEQMPSSLKSHGDVSHPFTIVKMPIVPLFDQWKLTQESVLKRLGIPCIPLSGYMIFEDQLLLVLSKRSALKAAMSAKRKTKKNPLKDEGPPGKTFLEYKKESQDVNEYARVILDIVNEKATTGNTYAIVSDKYVANPRNQDLVCFWIMGTKKLSAMIRVSGFGSTKIKSWGFPWVDLSENQLKKHKEFIHPSDNKDHPQYLEYDKNAHLRPPNWKTKDVPVRRLI